ncbi:hypothetical protein L7F22_022896 [Adiantum nelumboides]|nr:hypothetical protein [Adiantum nelumboides]
MDPSKKVVTSAFSSKKKQKVQPKMDAFLTKRPNFVHISSASNDVEIVVTNVHEVVSDVNTVVSGDSGSIGQSHCIESNSTSVPNVSVDVATENTVKAQESSQKMMEKRIVQKRKFVQLLPVEIGDAKAMYDVVNVFMVENGLEIIKLIAIATDGA